MTASELATFLRDDWPHIQKRAPLLALDVHEARKVCDALDAAVGLIRDLTLAIGDDQGCAKLTVKCTCGKATKLTAAHQQGAYIVRVLGEKEDDH